MSISTNYKFALSIILGIIFISVCTVNSQSISYFNSISYIPQPGPTNSNSILQIVLPYPDEDLDLLKSYSQKLVCNRITYDYLNDLNTLVETNYVSKVIKYPANTVTAALPPLGLGLRFKFDCQSQLINNGILGLISKNAVINSFKPPNKITGINMSYDEPEKELVISFTKPTENGSTINLIEFFMKGKNNRYTRVCVITDSTLTSCRVDMFKILDGPLYLENGDLLKVYGVASNEAGTSDRSYLLATLITVIGLAPVPPLPITFTLSPSKDHIILTMESFVNLKYYQIEYSTDNITFIDLVKNNVPSTYNLQLHTLDLGRMYYFRYKTENMLGKSSLSSPVSQYVACSVPDTMNAPTIYYSTSHPAFITIVLDSSTLNNCNTREFTLLLNDMFPIKWCDSTLNSCDFNSSLFAGIPFNLNSSSLLNFKISDENSSGSGEFSGSSNSLLLRTAPNKPFEIPYLVNVIGEEVYFKVNELPINMRGNTEILSYNVVVFYDNSNQVSLVGGINQLPFTDLDENVIFSNCQSGKTIQIVYRARNNIGYGDFSDPLDHTCS